MAPGGTRAPPMAAVGPCRESPAFPLPPPLSGGRRGPASQLGWACSWAAVSLLPARPAAAVRYLNACKLRSPDFLHPVFFYAFTFFFLMHLSTLQDLSRKVFETEEKPAEVTRTDGAYTDISPPSYISVTSIGAQPISQRMAASQAYSLLHPLACRSTVCVPCSPSSKHKAAPVSMLQTSMQDPCTAKRLASCLPLIMYLNQGLVNLCNVLTLVSCWIAQVLTRCLNRYSVVFWIRT